MNSLDELRQVLAEQADRASDGADLVAAAQAGARWHRQRRLAIVASGVAVLAILGVAAVPALMRGGAGTSGSSQKVTNNGRPLLSFTVGLDPGSGLTPVYYGVTRAMQYLVAGEDGIRATVAVYNPGALGSAARRFTQGTKVTVGGHSAYYLDDYNDSGPQPANPMGTSVRVSTAPGVRRPALAWQDPSGSWIVVYRSADLTWLYKVAAAVRLGLDGQVPSPVRLTYLPDHLTLTYTRTDQPEHGINSVLTLGQGALTYVPLVYPTDQPITIQSQVFDDMQDAVLRQLTPKPTKLSIGGHDAWYLTDAQLSNEKSRLKGSTLIVRAGTCMTTIGTLDAARYPEAELIRIASGMRFADCSRPSTWMTPLA
jgi:hypothetical protein